MINVHAPHNESAEDVKDDYYDALARAYDELPAHDIKIVIRDFNAKVGKEEVFRLEGTACTRIRMKMARV